MPPGSRCGDSAGEVPAVRYGLTGTATGNPPASPSRVAPWRRRVVVPYASWLSSGDNAWQMTAATLVGLMSIPALAVLYGGVVQRKWAVNTMMMVFNAFRLTLIV